LAPVVAEIKELEGHKVIEGVGLDQGYPGRVELEGVKGEAAAERSSLDHLELVVRKVELLEVMKAGKSLALIPTS
jgi:hypothetical protein